MYTLADRVQETGGNYEKGVVSVITKMMAAGASNLLDKIPIGSVKRLSPVFLTEEDEGPVAGIGSRALYGAYPEGTASLRQRGFTVGNVGGRAAVDQILMDEGDGGNPMDRQIAAKSRLLNRKINDGIINGDRSTSPNFFNGWKKWLLAANSVTPAALFGTTYANGLDADASATTQKAFLELIFYTLDQVGGFQNPDVYLVCNYQTQRQINKAIRELGWFGVNTSYYDQTTDSIGKVKFLNPGAKTAVKTFSTAINDTNAVIPNNFSFGTATTATEAWAVRFGLDDGMGLYERMPLKVTDIGRLQASPQEVVELEWWVGVYPQVDDCLAKISGIITV